MFKKIYVEFWNEQNFLQVVKDFENILFRENINTSVFPICISERNTILFFIKHFYKFKKFFKKSFLNILFLNNSKLKSNSQIFSTKNITNERDLLNYKIDNLEIGRDILEGYLIEKKVAKITFNNDFLQYMNQCINLYFYMKQYWNNHDKDSCLLLSHGLYKWGIISKAAISSGLSVFCVSAHSCFRLTQKDQYCIPKFQNYNNFFNSLNNNLKKKGIIWAKKRLAERLEGGVGIDILHNTKSAFIRNSKNLNIKIDKGQMVTVICPSCFFDNPHAYGNAIFTNFWDWLDFIGKNTDFKHVWLIKTHPDVLEGNLELIVKICKKHPHLKLIDHRISFHELYKKGVRLCLSFYGSVGHELPLIGINVVNCANNPHIAFKFNQHVKSKTEFKFLLKNPKLFCKPQHVNDIYKFYFIHFLHLRPISILEYCSNFKNNNFEKIDENNRNKLKSWINSKEQYMQMNISQVENITEQT